MVGERRAETRLGPDRACFAPRSESPKRAPYKASIGCHPLPKTVAIAQSNYIPWRGYFDLIGLADEFILLDDVQYTRRDWRNRNRIKLSNGVTWLTIPVEARGRPLPRIRDIKVSRTDWADRHWETLRHGYSKARYFASCCGWLEELYRGNHSEYLSEINRRFLMRICQALGIGTPLGWSFDYETSASDPTSRLVELCRRAGADRYLTGPLARGYLDASMFAAAGISVQWMDYSGYRTYPQLFPPFEPRLSVLDLLFNTGSEARSFLEC